MVADTRTAVTDTRTTVANTQTIVTDTQTTVMNTQTMVADAKMTVSNTQMMVADIHRNILTTAQAQARSAILDTTWSTVLHSYRVPLGELPPPAPRDCFGRDELIEKIIRLAQNLEPIAIIGAGGIGKTSVALTVLHHTRIEERFGENRRFIRCDQFPASRAHFLARLSKVIGAGVENPEDLTQLRPLLSSQEMLIVLDNAESILDPKESGAKEIYSVVDELCQFKKLSLCITSRLTMVPPLCKRPEIPTLTMAAACDIFYGIYGDSGRSSTINNLLERLDFHALSIKLLATTASHNGWDPDRLAEEWGAQRAQVLQTDYNESLAATIELSLSSPTFLSLGPDARDLLGVVAFFPQGVNEKSLDWLFPTVSNRKTTFDKFHVLSLTYRSNGFITMLAPIRDYLRPQDPLSSSLLCATRDRYFNRLSAEVDPDKPGFEEARWIVLEDVNVEYLIDVFTPTDQTSGDIWDTCFHFLEHIYWHKPRQTILASKIEALSDDHPSKPEGLTWLAMLFQRNGNHLERKRLLTQVLELGRQWGDEVRVVKTLQQLADTSQYLNLHKEGIRQAKEALEILERINDTVEKARVLNALANVLFCDYQLDAAEDAASRAIDLISDKGQEFIVCQLHRTLGLVHRTKGEKEKAIHHFRSALVIASPPKWHNNLFWAHFHLADLFRGEREFDDATAHLEQAKLHAADNVFDLGCATYMQAYVWYGQLRLEDAKSEALHALGIFEKLGAERDAGNSRGLLKLVERETESRSTGS
jgi:tetratricopeptide (TPR) repeat protein